MMEGSKEEIKKELWSENILSSFLRIWSCSTFLDEEKVEEKSVKKNKLDSCRGCRPVLFDHPNDMFHSFLPYHSNPPPLLDLNFLLSWSILDDAMEKEKEMKKQTRKGQLLFSELVVICGLSATTFCTVVIIKQKHLTNKQKLSHLLNYFLCLYLFPCNIIRT